MEIKIIIIEDEKLAISRIKRLLSELDDSFEIVAELGNVKEALKWFADNASLKIDLILADIQLTDGVSFEIFEKIKNTTPIIFTTAYDEYLMKAFKTYGIEYLLKPFSSTDLSFAINKYKTIFQNKKTENLPLDIFNKFFKQHNQHNFPTFISYSKGQIIPIKSEEISYFCLSNQIVYAIEDHKKWALNESLNQIQEKLPQYYFYRANRQHIINRKFISVIENDFGGRLNIKLTIKKHDEILINKDNCKSFKDWLQE